MAGARAGRSGPGWGDPRSGSPHSNINLGPDLPGDPANRWECQSRKSAHVGSTSFSATQRCSTHHSHEFDYFSRIAGRAPLASHQGHGIGAASGPKSSEYLRRHRQDGARARNRREQSADAEQLRGPQLRGCRLRKRAGAHGTADARGTVAHRGLGCTLRPRSLT